MRKNVINNLIPSRAGNDYVGEDIFIFRQTRATLRDTLPVRLTFSSLFRIFARSRRSMAENGVVGRARLKLFFFFFLSV